MPQADELRAGIWRRPSPRSSAAIADAAAQGNWETPKGTADDGEAGWSPRQVAEHVIPADVDVRQRDLRRLRLRRPRQPAEQHRLCSDLGRRAGRARRRRWQPFESKVRYVQDEELGKSAGGEGTGQQPRSRCVDGQGAMWHFVDHAAQIEQPLLVEGPGMKPCCALLTISPWR